MERELSFLAPDVATLISQGDGLILTVHASDPVRAERLKESSQDKLRTKWQEVKAVCEVSQQYKYRLLSSDILTFMTVNINWQGFEDHYVYHACLMRNTSPSIPTHWVK